MLNRELEKANNILRAKRNEVERIEEEVALLMQVSYVRCRHVSLIPTTRFSATPAVSDDNPVGRYTVYSSVAFSDSVRHLLRNLGSNITWKVQLATPDAFLSERRRSDYREKGP